MLSFRNWLAAKRRRAKAKPKNPVNHVSMSEPEAKKVADPSSGLFSSKDTQQRTDPLFQLPK